MRKLLFSILFLSYVISNAQSTDKNIYNSEAFDESLPKEKFNNWAVNLSFSDHGFGGGTTLFHTVDKDLQLLGGITFSSAKDDREFESTDMFGNTYVPGKINRVFMIPLSVGIQYRLFREEVTDELRPNLTGGLTPTMFVYTPYNQGLVQSFRYARAKYTIGAFLGIGVDYLTDETTSLSMNIRYQYTNLFGEGIEILEGKEKNYFGGLHFVFSYNFMK